MTLASALNTDSRKAPRGCRSAQHVPSVRVAIGIDEVTFWDKKGTPRWSHTLQANILLRTPIQANPVSVSSTGSSYCMWAGSTGQLVQISKLDTPFACRVEESRRSGMVDSPGHEALLLCLEPDARQMALSSSDWSLNGRSSKGITYGAVNRDIGRCTPFATGANAQ
jgi:hypothetical protein